MTEEKKECKCLVHCECFKKFLIVTFGSFLGVFFALCLFTAIHTPCPFGEPQFNKPFNHHGPKFEKQIPPMGEHQKPEKPFEHIKK